MTQVVWSSEAELSLLAIAVEDAGRILDAVDHMAATGRGFVRDMLDGRGTLGLYVGGYVVLFAIDDERTIRILRVRERAR